MWAFASEVSSADAKCEDLSYETGDIDADIRRLCQKVRKVSIVAENVAKSKNWLFQDEYCWCKMWAFASEVSSADAKCGYLLY